MSDEKLWGLGVDHKVTQQGEIRINCPVCPVKGKGSDTKFHCYVNLTKRVFNCYRCKSAGPLSQLKGVLANFNISPAPSQANVDKLKDRLRRVGKLKPISEFDLELVSWSIFDENCPIGYKYMSERGFTDEEMQKYGLRVGRNYKDPKTDEYVRKWGGRILFPFYEEDRVVFMVGRSYTSKEPKYRNSDGPKDHVVYGIDRVSNRVCILCEGIISAIAAERSTGVPAVSCLGKTATRYQLSKLRNHADRIYVALDGTSDVTDRDRRSLNRSLLKLGVEVFEVRLPEGKDPDDTGPEFKQCFEEAKRVKL